MAKRPAFFVKQGKVIREIYSFEWYSGFAVSQKQKSIKSLHNAIKKADLNARPLEISTKSMERIGIKASALHLKLNNDTLENVFQSAKVFEHGGPYLDLLDVSPKEAKRDERLHKSGSLKAFRYQNEEFPLIPQTVFYDFIYITAIKQSFTTDEVNTILRYNYFTDIEFNPAKSINTQARAAAILKLIADEYGYLPSFNKEDFIQYHKEHIFC
jgi:type I restriction enzyme M protein